MCIWLSPWNGMVNIGCINALMMMMMMMIGIFKWAYERIHRAMCVMGSQWKWRSVGLAHLGIRWPPAAVGVAQWGPKWPGTVPVFAFNSFRTGHANVNYYPTISSGALGTPHRTAEAAFIDHLPNRMSVLCAQELKSNSHPFYEFLQLEN